MMIFQVVLVVFSWDFAELGSRLLKGINLWQVDFMVR